MSCLEECWRRRTNGCWSSAGWWLSCCCDWTRCCRCLHSERPSVGSATPSRQPGLPPGAKTKNEWREYEKLMWYDTHHDERITIIHVVTHWDAAAYIKNFINSKMYLMCAWPFYLGSFPTWYHWGVCKLYWNLLFWLTCHVFHVFFTTNE